MRLRTLLIRRLEQVTPVSPRRHRGRFLVTPLIHGVTGDFVGGALMTIEEAVSRFFPASLSYDRGQAQRMIRWLDKCGYAIVPKDQAQAKSSVRPLSKPPRKVD